MPHGQAPQDAGLDRVRMHVCQAAHCLDGIHRILELETQVEAMRNRLVELTAENQALREALGRTPRVFAAGLSGEVVTLRAGTRPRGPASSSTLAVWRPQGWPFGD